MDFADGDLVKLKSGGPTMTIEQVGKTSMTKEDAVWCVWFGKVGNKRVVQRDTFSPIVLKAANSNASTPRVIRTRFK